MVMQILFALGTYAQSLKNFQNCLPATDSFQLPGKKLLKREATYVGFLFFPLLLILTEQN